MDEKQIDQTLNELIQKGLVEVICGECGKTIDLNTIKYRLTAQGEQVAKETKRD